MTKLYVAILDGKLFKYNSSPLRLAFIIENNKVIGNLPITLTSNLRSGEETEKQYVLLKLDIETYRKLELYFSNDLKYDLEPILPYSFFKLLYDLDETNKDILNQELKAIGFTKFTY